MSRTVDFIADDHIWPDGHKRKHELDRSCWCNPEIVQVGPKTFSVVHDGNQAPGADQQTD